MNYGPFLLIECPCCKKQQLVPTCMSWNSFDAVIWSDGRIEGGESFPQLSRCPDCKTFIWVYKVPVVKEVEWEFRRDGINEFDPTPWVEALALDEFKEALTAGLCTKSSEEVYVRVNIWRSYNDRTRTGEPLYQQNGDRLFYLDNLVRLDALLCEKEELLEDEEHDPDEEIDKILLRAEGYRNRKKFEQCLALLHGLPKEYKFEKAKQLIAACNEKKSSVFVIKLDALTWMDNAVST